MEREFHSWLKAQSHSDPRIKIGIGDDAAVLRGFNSNAGIVVTTDAIADGTHFDLAQHSLESVGRKSLAVSLSDIAAMGARPIAAVLSLMLPNDFSLNQAQQIFTGCSNLANEFSVLIVGGDTNRWAGKLVVSSTVIGREFSDSGACNSWTMNTARVNDVIVVSGEFGGSLFGHHLEFQPRVELAEYLINNYTIHAATDASDSLSLDLDAIATASKVGVELFANQIPVSSAAHRMAAKSGKTPLSHALTDGEDFELILTIPESEIEPLMSDTDCCNELAVIGRCVGERGFWMFEDGKRNLFQPTGYSH